MVSCTTIAFNRRVPCSKGAVTVAFSGKTINYQSLLSTGVGACFFAAGLMLCLVFSFLRRGCYSSILFFFLSSFIEVFPLFFTSHSSLNCLHFILLTFLQLSTAHFFLFSLFWVLMFEKHSLKNVTKPYLSQTCCAITTKISWFGFFRFGVFSVPEGDGFN